MTAVVIGLLSLVATIAFACGPFFPNNMLDSDQSLLVAPTADFERELERLKLAPNRFEAVITTNRYEQATLDAEISDLAAALKKAKIPADESASIIEAHRANRKMLSDFSKAHGEWDDGAESNANGAKALKPKPEPVFPLFSEVPGLPGEFADYFAGVAALRRPGASNDEFIGAWKRLLARPPTERKYKSVWAAYMLGKTHEKSDDDKAIEYYRMTRDLAKQRFVDSSGLAAASIGWEAQAELRRKHYARAIKLYLEQYTTGDGSAVVSLIWSARQALDAGGDALPELAADANARAVVTAYLISSERQRENSWNDAPQTNSSVAWLVAVETVGVKDVESAEKLALAAYQTGEFQIAQRWINRAKNSPVAQWLQAKLLLRAGKIEPAAALLAKISRSFPLDPPGTNGPANFAESLSVSIGEAGDDPIPAGRQVLGELGALRLVRRDFVQSLDALLRSGYWQDAAYVAERVLTVEELKKYVDEQWPAVSTAEEKTETIDRSDSDGGLDNHRQSIRHLLARRLVRLSRGDQAKSYFPEEYQPELDTFVASLNIGWDESRPQSERSRAFFQAAIIARANGMELLGTEVGPDWAVYGGGFEFGRPAESRTNEKLKILFASSDELRRAASHDVEPEERFHYRYQAAALAWEAAKLMPDNSDETARVLCTAGTWLKYRDPETADFFYKQLVRRCRKTAIGEQADRMRWFPVLDESGNPKPYQPRQKSIESSTLEPSATETIANHSPVSGPYYTIQAGDSLEAIARDARLNGQAITAKDLITANPGLDPRKLWVGQVIFIPAPSAETNAPAN